MVLVYDSPNEHPRVTWKEIALIARNRRDSTVEKVRVIYWEVNYVAVSL